MEGILSCLTSLTKPMGLLLPLVGFAKGPEEMGLYVSPCFEGNLSRYPSEGISSISID